MLIGLARALQVGLQENVQTIVDADFATFLETCEMISKYYTKDFKWNGEFEAFREFAAGLVDSIGESLVVEDDEWPTVMGRTLELAQFINSISTACRVCDQPVSIGEQAYIVIDRELPLVKWVGHHSCAKLDEELQHLLSLDKST